MDIYHKLLTENDEEIATLIDIISMSPNAPRNQRYKDILKQKYGIDYDVEYGNHDEDLITNASLDNIKTKKDFLDFDKYREYADKIFKLRGLGKIQPKHINLDVPIEVVKSIGDRLGFEVRHREYSGFGNYAQVALLDRLEMPKIADVNTIIHEIGHVFHNLIYGDGVASMLTNASSYYGVHMTHEVFAENYLHFFIAPKFLKQHLPEVYSDLNRKIPSKWKLEMKQLMKYRK